jgi:hypothetical protein
MDDFGFKQLMDEPNHGMDELNTLIVLIFEARS